MELLLKLVLVLILCASVFMSDSYAKPDKGSKGKHAEKAAMHEEMKSEHDLIMERFHEAKKAAMELEGEEKVAAMKAAKEEKKAALKALNERKGSGKKDDDGDDEEKGSKGKGKDKGSRGRH